jgi:NADP-dependent 3-hydroxy acid dehydrogenase YdfG
VKVIAIIGASSGVGLGSRTGAKRVLIACSAKTLKHLVARIANMEGKVIDAVGDVADREKFASRHTSRLIFWLCGTPYIKQQICQLR